MSVPYPFPAAEAFKGQFGDKLDFCLAPDLVRLANRLDEKYDPKFAHIAQLRIAYLWKARGGEKGGKFTLGKTQRPSGLLAYYAQTDFVVWLAADNCRLVGMDERKVEATLFHELCHIGADPETDEPCLLPHDVEMFADEVREYGLWRSDLECLRQLGLFERVDRETGEVFSPSAYGSLDAALRGETPPHAQVDGGDYDRQHPARAAAQALVNTGDGNSGIDLVTFSRSRGTHYRDDNPARPPMVCRDAECTLPHHPAAGH